MIDDVEKWIVEHYGKYEHSIVDAGFFEVHAVAVPLMNGVSIGMGENLQLALHDLYLDLKNGFCPVQVGVTRVDLHGFWKQRRQNLWAKSLKGKRCNGS